jgi:hypothetical protein
MYVFQRRLFASPHCGLRLAFTCVISFHSPMGPAHTSGGFEKVSRTTADVFPSPATDTYGTNPPRASVSGPVQTGVAVPFKSRCETKVSPFMIPATRIPPEFGSDASDVAVDFDSGVRFFIVPPSAEVEYTSPPGMGSSLINPPMKMICLPSGDQRGFEISPS